MSDPYTDDTGYLDNGDGSDAVPHRCVCCGEMVAWVNLDGVCFPYCNMHSLVDTKAHRDSGEKFWVRITDGKGRG